MSAELVIATGNAGKVREIRRILEGVNVSVQALSELPVPVPEPEEHGHTFAENARDKALYYASKLRRMVVAEDSGLEIDALDGAPGVYSARFGLPGARTYPEKFDLIYRMLRERTGGVDSAARFVCSLALARPGEIVFEAAGVVEGRIVEPPRGEGGFGYDPIFYYPPFAQTLAQVPADRKAEVSHRGKAFGKLRGYFSRQ